jgi:hypothetical protein
MSCLLRFTFEHTKGKLKEAAYYTSAFVWECLFGESCQNRFRQEIIDSDEIEFRRGWSASYRRVWLVVWISAIHNDLLFFGYRSTSLHYMCCYHIHHYIFQSRTVNIYQRLSIKYSKWVFFSSVILDKKDSFLSLLYLYKTFYSFYLINIPQKRSCTVP